MMNRNKQSVKSVIVTLSLSLEQPKRPHPRRLDSYDAFPSFLSWRFPVLYKLEIADLSQLPEITTAASRDTCNLTALCTLIRSTTSLVASTTEHQYPLPIALQIKNWHGFQNSLFP
jgi:hypothetical protein